MRQAKEVNTIVNKETLSLHLHYYFPVWKHRQERVGRDLQQCLPLQTSMKLNRWRLLLLAVLWGIKNIPKWNQRIWRKWKQRETGKEAMKDRKWKRVKEKERKEKMERRKVTWSREIRKEQRESCTYKHTQMHSKREKEIDEESRRWKQFLHFILLSLPSSWDSIETQTVLPFHFIPFHSLSYFMTAHLLSCPPHIFNTFLSSALLSSSLLFSLVLSTTLFSPPLSFSINSSSNFPLPFLFLHWFLYHSHYLVALYRFSQIPYFSAVLELPSNSSMSTSSLTSLQQDR